MNEVIARFSQLLRQRGVSSATVTLKIGTVASVSDAIATVDVDGQTHYVHFSPLGTADNGIIPVAGSMCAFWSDEEEVMLWAEKCAIRQTAEPFVLNGGDNGEVIIASKLVDQLSHINNILQTLQTILQTPISEPGNGAPSAFQAALSAALSGKPLPNYSQITNPNFQH